MKNKFMRSVTAMVVAVTMLISSQGVVTSFADGGDHSDMSESSSVQMNEVGNNGTDQSTEDGVAQCNCGATDGEAHKEGCPLYVKPDGGNTEDDAAQCTCGAKEGEPHQENCPLYVKPDDGNTNNGDTDNGAGEDADIKSVVDAINDLPAVETITEETDLVSLKDQVNAARAAYDALSAEQKESFDATVLEKLTALEAKISELESGEQETAPSEAVQNVIEKIDAAVEQIDYTTETISATDGTTVTKTHITMLKDLDPANNAELKALIDKEAAHEQDENQPALTDEEAAKLSDARKAFEDAKAKYLSEGFSNAQLAARQAYDALATEEEKAQVTNYSLLEAMEENIAYIMQAVNTLPTSVAEINGILYDTLDEAIADAEDGDTIEILQDCTTQNGFSIFGKSLIIDGNNHAITVDNLGIYLLNNGSNIAELTFKNCKQLNISPVSGTPTAAGNSAPWASVIVSFDCILTFDNCTVNIQQPIGDTKVHTGLYYHVGSKINLNNTVMSVTGFTTNGFSADVNDEGLPYTSELNVLNGSNLTVSQNRAGLTAALKVTVTDSKLTNSNNRGNASNGADYIITNSEVDISGNGTHGMSARNVEIVNSNVTCEGNGGYGLNVTRSLTIDTSSTLDVIGNSWAGDDSGLQINNGAIANIASGATVNIKDNKCSGLSNWGTCTFEEGSKLTITGNINDKGNFSRGGGIYNTKSTAHLTLPSDAVIYNNHAKTGGDDIYNTGEITFSRVGTDWTLDDCNHKITGWYDDSDNSRWEAHEKPYHINEFVKFERNGMTTVKGLLSLKAAHGVDPINPGDPGTTEWEHSKSKTATNLDKNYQSQVTLSLPSAEEQLVSDVVFVLDKSTSATVEKQMLDMLGSLKDQVTETGAKVKVGVIIFNKEAHSVLELTELNSDNMGKIQEAIGTTISSGTNTHAGLLAGKAMLDADTSVDANRKYMILVSDGMTYMFDEPAQAINSIQATNGENEVMAGTDCWGIRHYLEGKDSFIPEDWTSYLQDVGSKLTEIEQYIQPYDNMDKTNYISKGNTELPTTVDVALYKTQEVFKQMQNNGYHCYSVLAQTNITNYPWGPAFMNYLAGGKEVSFNDIQNDIYYLLDAGSQVVDVIGEGVDNAGNEYNFDFVDKIENIDVKVGGEIISKERIADPQFSDPYITTAYGFGDGSDNNHEEATQYPNYDFVVKYYANGRDGKSDECFVWEMNTAVSNFAPVQLTYTVQLTNPQTTDGTYGQYDEDGSEKYTSLYTNKEAILYPVDTNHNSGVAEYFQKPTVSYSISNGKPVDPPVDPEDPTPRPGGGGDEDDDTPTIINDTPVPTTTIDDEDVPLTDLPEDTVTIDDEEVPLKDIPNTGDMIPVPAMVAAVISIGGIALLMKKHK